MRTPLDRLRHTILFELLGLAIVITFVSVVLRYETMRIGVLSVGMCLWAMVWNAIYNYLFDVVLVHCGRSLRERPVWLRVLHSVLFEAGLLVLALPAVAWWMKMTLWEAFLMDLGFAVFYLIYGFIYNWLYDLVFPVPEDFPVAEESR